MGMGEPLLNYDNLIKAIEILTSTWGAGLSSRHVAISTAGIIPGIKKLAVFSKQVKLSISLHSLRDDVRTRLMPINKKYPVAELLKAARFYVQKTNKLITFEYLLIGEVNDRREDAEALARAMANIPSKLNLITYNAIDKSIFRPPSPDRIRQFKEILNRYGINFTEREKKGGDIEAACGQLYLKSLKS
jgi:23S rRNA (adenine2503-C2)-methyltransferase